MNKTYLIPIVNGNTGDFEHALLRLKEDATDDIKTSIAACCSSPVNWHLESRQAVYPIPHKVITKYKDTGEVLDEIVSSENVVNSITGIRIESKDKAAVIAAIASLKYNLMNYRPFEVAMILSGASAKALIEKNHITDADILSNSDDRFASIGEERPVKDPVIKEVERVTASVINFKQPTIELPLNTILASVKESIKMNPSILTIPQTLSDLDVPGLTNLIRSGAFRLGLINAYNTQLLTYIQPTDITFTSLQSKP